MAATPLETVVWRELGEACGIGVYLLTGWKPAVGSAVYLLIDDDGDLLIAPTRPVCGAWLLWSWPGPLSGEELARLAWERWTHLTVH